MKGFVYFIKINGLDPIKIGYTTDSKGISRFETAKTYAPFGATYFAHIPTLNAPALEFELHERFKDKRLKGEWFDLTQNEIAKIVYQKGGKFGEPTIDFDEFVKDESEKEFMVKQYQNHRAYLADLYCIYGTESQFNFKNALHDTPRWLNGETLTQAHKLSKHAVCRLLNPKKGYFTRSEHGVYRFAISVDEWDKLRQERIK